MVSILPSERTPFDVLGRELGKSLQSFGPSFEKGYERGQGLNAIDQLETDLAKAGGDPMKMTAALARAYTLNPNLQRSGIAEQVMKQAVASNQSGALNDASNSLSNGASSAALTGGGETQRPNQEVSQPIPKTTPIGPKSEVESKQSAKDIDTIANQTLAELRPDLVNPATEYGAIATFEGINKQDLTPSEEAQLRDQLFKKYKNPDVVNSTIDRIREGIQNRYKEALSKYGFDKERLQQIQNKWNTFTGGTAQRLEPHLQKFGDQFPRTKEILQGKYNQYAANSGISLTPEQMHTNSMALLQNDINKLDALHSLPSMPPIRSEGGVKDWIETNKKTYKDLADLGFTEALREDAILNKDIGNEEFHSLLWGDQTSKPLLNEIHSFKAPQEYISRSPTDINKTPRYNSNYPKERERYINNLSGKLRNLKPQDDLVLARSMVLDSGGSIKDFGDALQEAQEKGLELSQFQKSQLQEINIPRVPPLWEIFSEKRFTMPLLKAWGPWINYIRGKK